MCGIAGMAWQRPTDGFGAVGAAMMNRLRHRGPDDEGWLTWSDEGLRRGRGDVDDGPARAMLLHRRLAILDLTDTAAQPMSSPDGRYHLVFNGEIYNYRELRPQLEAEGWRFRSSGDTEVLLAGYAHWGADVLAKLVGMFAFAVLDTERRWLVMARDCFGIKPLYYTQGAPGVDLAFASEIKALLELPGLSREVDPQRVWEYLRLGQADHDDGAMFRAIKQVPPAHYVDVSLDELSTPPTPIAYWSAPRDGELDISFDEAAERLRDMFFDSVRLHLRSDVPLGVALSGGVDSSAILCAVRPVAGDDLELNSFSYVARDSTVDEERWVDMAGQAAGAVMHRETIEPDELVASLDDLIRIQDEPFGSSSIFAQCRVFELAKKAGVKVLLDGQGADELMAGYPVCGGARVASLIRAGRWLAAWKLLRRATTGTVHGRWRLLATAGAFVIPGPLTRPARRLLGEQLYPDWLDRGWFRDQQVSPDVPENCRAADQLRAYLHELVTRRSLPMLLRYDDRNAMAQSIETRVPFLTPDLAAFVLALPESYLLADDGATKSVFRQAMRGLVPDPILVRRDKIGFQTPEREWLGPLGAWIDQVLDSDAARRVTPLRLKHVRRQWEGVRDGRLSFDYRVWRWINLIRWAELYDVSF